MRRTLQLAAAALLVAGMASHAQMHLHANKPQVEDISWMWPYTQPGPESRENRLVLDPHFMPFLERNLRAPQTFWTKNGKHSPLSDVAEEFLMVPGEVIGEENRYITADGCVPHFCEDRGMLWVDLRPTNSLVVFAAIDWISENRSTEDKDAAYTMWVFSSRALNTEHLPPALTRSIARWTTHPSRKTELQNITRVFLVDPDGTPHPVAPFDIGAHNTLPAETTKEPTQSLSTTPKAQQ
ncbi:hypothetical protein [Edaphobacter flagellatus]|uniref:hypothetical protein n=1 Tax=Edaphobacter flagellatus TaxID=1933044 RepID=UPI0021B23548|nr:hypothetical protein [Edaphobacter flagellatus]